MTNNKQLRVLSIDFDYFQNTNKYLLHDYPDGIDVSTELSQVIWAAHYAQNDALFGISVDNSELTALFALLDQQDKNCPVMIAQTHKDIYEFIKQHIPCKNAEIDIVNIDMHSDFKNRNQSVDCGNWLGNMMHRYHAKAHWVMNPVAAEAYQPLPKINDNFEILGSIREVILKDFDIIFLCRSDNWVPPHLDVVFGDIVDLLKDHFPNTVIHDDVDKPRAHYEIIYKNIKSQVDKCKQSENNRKYAGEHL